MSIRVTITKSGVADAYGIAMAVGTTYTVADDFGLSLIQQGKATDTDGVQNFPGNSPFDEVNEGIVAGLSTSNTLLAATANYAIIQSNLNARGLVQMLTPGTYYINSTLVIPSGTHLVGSTNGAVILKQYAGTNKLLLKTAAYDTAPTSVTLTWSAGVEVSVAWTGHGLTTEDYIVIQGAAQYAYNTVAKVGAVTDANNVVVQIQRVPSGAASGTILARKCTRDFSISNIAFDYDYTNNATGAATDRFTTILGYAGNFILDRVKCLNIYKYGLNVGAAMDYTVLDCVGIGTQSGSSSEALKTYGPARNGLVIGLTGTTTDDFASVQPSEDALFSTYRWTSGDISNIKFIGSRGQSSGGTAIHPIYCDDNYNVTDIFYEDVFGVTTHAAGSIVALTRNASGTTGIFGNIEVNGVHGSTAGATAYAVALGGSAASGDRLRVTGVDARAARQVYGLSGLTCKQVEVEGCIRNLTTDTATSIYFNNCAMKRLAIRNNLFSQTAASTAYGIELVNSGTATESIEISGNTFNGATNMRGMQLFLGTVRSLRIQNNHMRLSGDQLALVNGCTSASIVARDNDTDSAAVLAFTSASAAVSATVVAEGNVATANSNGFFRITQTTNACAVTLRTANNVISNAAHVTVVSGTPTLTIFSNDLAVDPLALTGLATTNQQTLVSTRVTANCQGPSVRTGAGWVALGTGAAGVNTVIT